MACIITFSSSANNLHVNDGSSIADIIGGDVFFEITEPVELEYTYRIRPAKDFGAPFVSAGFKMIVQVLNYFWSRIRAFRLMEFV